MNCVICGSTFDVTGHHHPRRSSGVVFGELPIEKDDPRRLIDLCLLCHGAIHKHELILDRWRDGLHFELNKVTQEDSAHDVDLLFNSEGEIVWSQKHWPGNPDNQFSEVVERFREGSEAAIKPMYDFLPFALRQHYESLMMEVTDLNSQRLDRIKTALRVLWLQSKSFGWTDDGKAKSPEQRIRETAELWGTSVSTIKDDVAIVEVVGMTHLLQDSRYRSAILEEARQNRLQARGQSIADEPECPDSPDGKHVWRIVAKRCQICGVEK